MERAREEPQQQQGQPQTPLRCPRCDSLDTKFRYFNNNSLAQPRRYCKTCRRQWTVGGKIRNMPIGGRPRSGKPTKASSSRGGNPRSQPPQPPLQWEGEHRQNPHSLTAMTAMVSQNFDTTMFQPVTNLPSAESPLESYYSNEEIPCLDAIQSLIQPEINNQHFDMGSHFSSGANLTTPQEWGVQTRASQQATPQQIPRKIEAYQTHNEAIKATPSHLYTNTAVRPAWPMNSSPQDITNDFRFTTSNTCLWHNFSGDANNTEDTTSVNVDEWLNFPDNDPL